MNHHRGLLAIALVTLCAGAAAQSGYRKIVSPEHAFELKVPKFVEQQPLEPMEEQILAKFQGRQTARLEGETGEFELILLVIRIAKATGPTTGATPVDEEVATNVSLKGQSRAWLNGATTIEEFLRRREWVSQRRLENTLKKPPMTADDRVYDIYEVSSNKGAKLAVRAFTLEDDSEIFGLVALGVGAVDAFHPQIMKAVQSLERVAATGASGTKSGDIYAGTALRDVERRAVVRRRLADGWEAHDTEDFILVTNVANKGLINNMLADLQIMRAAYAERFPPLGEMEQVSTVRVCASYEDYMRYGAPDGTAGYWHPLDEELVLFDPGKRIPKAQAWLKSVAPEEVMYHEAMHQYLHYANGHVPPASWFNEGYGEVFGGAKVARRSGEITKIDKNKSRLPWIKRAQKQNAWPDLRILLKMSQSEFYGSSALQNYAMAWAFCYFLEEERAKKGGKRNGEWAAIADTYLLNLRSATQTHLKDMPEDAPRDWVSAFADDIQAEAFEKTFAKMDLAALEQAWIAAMRKY